MAAPFWLLLLLVCLCEDSGMCRVLRQRTELEDLCAELKGKSFAGLFESVKDNGLNVPSVSATRKVLEMICGEFVGFEHSEDDLSKNKFKHAWFTGKRRLKLSDFVLIQTPLEKISPLNDKRQVRGGKKRTNGMKSGVQNEVIDDEKRHRSITKRQVRGGKRSVNNQHEVKKLGEDHGQSSQKLSQNFHEELFSSSNKDKKNCCRFMAPSVESFEGSRKRMRTEFSKSEIDGVIQTLICKLNYLKESAAMEKSINDI